MLPKLEDFLVLASTIYGVARGEPYDGQKAVGHVVKNRTRADLARRSVAQICLEGRVFHCWTAGAHFDAIQRAGLHDRLYRRCLRSGLESFDEDDFTGGATAFLTVTQLQAGWPDAWGRPSPACYEVGNHVFFNLRDY